MAFAESSLNDSVSQRRAKIVATLGPASNTVPVFRELVRAGVDVDDIAQSANVTRELALIKVGATVRNRSQIFELVEVFRARIVDLTAESLMIEMTGVESKIEGLIEVLRESESPILEICRSGKMTMRRGHHISSVLKAMGKGSDELPLPENEPEETSESADIEPA